MRALPLLTASACLTAWIATGLAAALVTTPAAAQQACDKPADDFDGFYCLNKAFVEADQLLNAEYKRLALQLPAEPRGLLRQSQLAWMAHRNKTCTRKLDTGFFVNLACATNSTLQRLEYVQARLQECASAGCGAAQR